MAEPPGQSDGGPLARMGAAGEALPPVVCLRDERLRLLHTFKDSTISAVGLYGGERTRAVLKVYRYATHRIVPLQWLAAVMASHEAQVLRLLAEVPGVPRLYGMWGRAGVLREYVPGRPFGPECRVEDGFFAELRAMLSAIHARGIAYVDLEKPDNVLVGDDGHPWLIDFQIAYYVPRRLLGETWPFRALRRFMQAADEYHAAKHWRHNQKHAVPREEYRRLRRARRRPWFIRLYNALDAPFKKLRRWFT